VTEQIRTFEQTSPSHPTPQSIILRQLPWSMPEPFKKRLWWRAMLAQRAARDRVRGSLARWCRPIEVRLPWQKGV